MSFELRDFTILLQNLTNRAVEIELHNAKLEERLADLDKVESALDGVMAIARKRIVEFSKRKV